MGELPTGQRLIESCVKGFVYRLLGRFTEGWMMVLQRLRDKLRGLRNR